MVAGLVGIVVVRCAGPCRSILLRDGRQGMSGTRRKPGRMGAHVEGYRSFLLGFGYTSDTVRGMLKVLGQLGRWMEAGGLDPADLGEVRLDEFLAARRADATRQVPCRRVLLLLLDFLRAGQVIGPATPPLPSPVDGAVAGYVDWLVTDRGLAATTVVRYRRTAWRFLTQRLVGSVGPWTGLTGAEVNAFLLAECRRCSVGAAKGRVAEIRSLLRYGYLHRLVELPLAGSIPPVAGWHHTSIPISVSPRVVELLLDSCDRATPVGLRDFAVLMLLARLGLRSIEVARLRLDDIDWRNGLVRIRGKGGQLGRLPLPVDVGESLTAYLRNGRPLTSLREVFITGRAPRQAIRADLVGDVVQRACRRASVPQVGPHRLRHALATDLMAHGVALRDISQVLRHRDLATTAIYAKVDLVSLRAVARPWPGALS